MIHTINDIIPNLHKFCKLEFCASKKQKTRREDKLFGFPTIVNSSYLSFHIKSNKRSLVDVIRFHKIRITLARGNIL